MNWNVNSRWGMLASDSFTFSLIISLIKLQERERTCVCWESNLGITTLLMYYFLGCVLHARTGVSLCWDLLSFLPLSLLLYVQSFTSFKLIWSASCVHVCMWGWGVGWGGGLCGCVRVWRGRGAWMWLWRDRMNPKVHTSSHSLLESYHPQQTS